MTVVLRRILATAAIAALGGLAALGVARAGAPAQPVPLSVAAPAPAESRTAAPVAADLELELDAILAAETSPAKADKAAARGELRRLAASRRLVHATVVVDLKDGGLTTIQLDRTVALGSETRVRRAGAKAAISDLKAADAVFVMSKVETDGRSAYLVVVPRR
jgi:hypothetical protein